MEAPLESGGVTSRPIILPPVDVFGLASIRVGMSGFLDGNLLTKTFEAPTDRENTFMGIALKNTDIKHFGYILDYNNYSYPSDTFGFASIALRMNSGKRMENTQPLVMIDEGISESTARGSPKPRKYGQFVSM